jgi:hypothetical protein|tara:strand:+ start:647 stop:1234 length:588 start_codon:yes stop_codon:yes gene_type:complete
LAVPSSGALNDQPNNVNFLSPLGFNFAIKKLPNTNYFVQSVNVPSVQMGDAIMPTPFVNIPTIGDRISYAEFQVSFKVDEDLRNYIELYDWMVQLGFPEDFSQAKNIYEKQNNVDFMAEGPYSDATITILNSAMRPNLEVLFEDAYPISLSDLQFSATSPSVDYIECQVTFRYKLFRILRLESAGTVDTQSTNVR